MIVIQHIDNRWYVAKNTGVSVYLAEAMKYNNKEEAKKARLAFDRPRNWRVLEVDEKQAGAVDQSRKQAIWGNASDESIAQAKNEIMALARATSPFLERKM